MPPPVYRDASHLKYHLYTEQGEKKNNYGKYFIQFNSTHMYSYSVSWRMYYMHIRTMDQNVILKEIFDCLLTCIYMLDWLTDWLIDWLIDKLID